MANKRLDLTGKKFGKLTAIEPNGSNEKGLVTWKLRCECGNEVTRTASRLTGSEKRGVVQSCGCTHHLKTHGLSVEFKKLRWVWVAMRQRCYNPSNKDYPNYGARGITICNEWDNFKDFHSWAVSTGYREGVTIERVDVNGNYDPTNCTWIVNERQALNTRKIRKFEYK
ncbi:MAG: hypothetical protein ACRC8W_21145, partial [Plesiomonas shigelloides]